MSEPPLEVPEAPVGWQSAVAMLRRGLPARAITRELSLALDIDAGTATAAVTFARAWLDEARSP